MNSFLNIQVDGYEKAKVYVKANYRGNAFASFDISADGQNIYTSGTLPDKTSGTRVLINNTEYDISNKSLLKLNANDLGYNSNGGYVFEFTIELS